MSIVLQKAVTPAQVTAYFSEGYDRVSGYVVRAAEVSSVTTTAALRSLHHLDYEGSPFPAEGPVHVLHMDRSPSWQLLPATQMKEREVMSTSGTVEVDEGLVELFYLDHTRITSGARLWRFEDGEDPVLVGTYHGPAFGWQDHVNGDVLKSALPLASTGSVVVLGDKAFVADVTSADDGSPTQITAVAPSEPPAELGFVQNQAERWVRGVEHSEARALFELRVTATWNGLPVIVCLNFKLPDGMLATRVSSFAHDYERAAAAKLTEVELGVWEATVPSAEVKDITPQEVAAQPWMTPWQKDRIAKAQAAAQNNTVRPPAPAPAPGGNVATSGFAPEAPSGPGPTVTPDQPAEGKGPSDAAHVAIYQRIAQGILAVMPPEAKQVQVLCQSVGNVMEIGAQAVMEDGSPALLPTISQDVARAFGELRTLDADPEAGTWFGCIMTLDRAGKLAVNFNKEQKPALRQQITAAMLQAERTRYPRGNWPQWFTDLEAELG